jgi:hypothetical protein
MARPTDILANSLTNTDSLVYIALHVTDLGTPNNTTTSLYCDMTPESWNSPLLDNGSLSSFSIQMRIRGDRFGMERASHVNGIKKGSHGYAQATNIFHGYR